MWLRLTLDVAGVRIISYRYVPLQISGIAVEVVKEFKCLGSHTEATGM